MWNIHDEEIIGFEACCFSSVLFKSTTLYDVLQYVAVCVVQATQFMKLMGVVTGY